MKNMRLKDMEKRVRSLNISILSSRGKLWGEGEGQYSKK